jgi:hypothetical protein
MLIIPAKPESNQTSQRKNVLNQSMNELIIQGSER